LKKNIAVYQLVRYTAIILLFDGKYCQSGRGKPSFGSILEVLPPSMVEVVQRGTG
jgi:hypothetical protein